MDREKVIKGLETCRTRVNCKGCPYAYDKRANDSYCEAVLHNDVLALLKEQEAKPGHWIQSNPKFVSAKATGGSRTSICSNCGKWGQKSFSFCPHCGAKMEGR